jgi:hypothetical protein
VYILVQGLGTRVSGLETWMNPEKSAAETGRPSKASLDGLDVRLSALLCALVSSCACAPKLGVRG